MARDNAPIGHTCPMIDEVLSLIDIEFDYNDSEEKICAVNVSKASEIMEKIRKANAELRDWGNELYQEKEELIRELDTANKEISSLTDEITELKNNVEGLEYQVRQLEKELDDVLEQTIW